MVEMPGSSKNIGAIFEKCALGAGILGVAGILRTYHEAVSSGMSAGIEAVTYAVTANPEVTGLLALGAVRLGMAAKRSNDISERQANPNELSDECRNL